MIKKLISGALSAAILFTTAVTSGYIKTPGAGETQTTRTANESNNGDYQLEASNSLGNYISDAMQNKEKPKNMSYMWRADFDYDIGFVEFDTETGIMTIYSSQPDDASIAIFVKGEDSQELVYSTEISVSRGENTVNTVQIDVGALPEFFLADLQLFDKNKMAVGQAYTLTTYTRFNQEMKATDIYDYEEEYVVNLDEDESTNFVVLNENTIQGETTEDTNILISADYKEDQYVFENIDDTIRYLSKGDHFFIRPTENDIIALSVGDITIDGNRATLTGDENTEGLFDVIKIDASADDVTDVVVNEDNELESIEDSSVAENEVSEETLEFTSENEYKYEATDVKYDKKIDLEFEFSKEFGKKDDKDDESDEIDLTKPDFSNKEIDTSPKKMKISGEITGKFKFSSEFSFQFYQKWLHVDFEIKFSPKLTVEVECAGKIEIPLKGLTHPIGFVIVPGLWFGFKPELTFTIEGKIKYTFTKGYNYVWSFDSSRKKMFSYTCEPNEENGNELVIEANISISLDFQPMIYLFSADVVAIILSVPIEVGLNVETNNMLDTPVSKTDTSPQTFIFKKYDEDKVHTCEYCLAIKPYYSVNITFELEVKCIPLLEKISLTLFEYDSKEDENTFMNNLKLYSSLTHGVTDFGDCPYNAYKTKINLLGTDNISKSDIEVIVDGIKGKADPNGVYNFYCENGHHNYIVSVDGEKAHSGSFVIVDAVKSISVSLADKTDSSSDGEKIVTTAPVTGFNMPSVTEVIPEFPAEKRYIESGRLGDNIFYFIYPNGEMNIHGHGDMYKSSPEIKNIKSVTTVTIQDDAPYNDKYITSISDSLFNGASNLETVYLSDNIQKIGDFAFKDCSKLKYFRYGNENDQNKTLRLPKDLTHIGYCAFANCKSAAFDELIMPDNISYIGGQAFSNCNGLTSIIINGNDTTIDRAAFYQCHNLKEALFGDGVSTFEEHILCDCNSIEKLTLPRVDESFHRNIGELFYVEEPSDPEKTYTETGYTGTPKSLTSITVLGGKSIDTISFKGMCYLKEINLPEGITSIGSYAFADCTNVNLDAQKLLKDVEKIDERAFLNCSSIEFGNIVFSDNIKAIGMCAFEKCTGINSLVVNGKQTSIGKYAFSDCYNLKEAEFGNGVSTLGESILADCYSLEKLTLARTDSIYYNVGALFSTENPADPEKVYEPHSTDYYGIPKSLKSVTILGGTEIYDGSFSGFSNLEEVFIPEGLTKIGHRAFENCTNVKLDAKKLLKDVESVGEYAFDDCSSIEFGDIVIPESIATIPQYTFNNCTGITGVYFYKNTEYINNHAFNGCNSIEKVQYEGTDEEWNEFEFRIDSYNDPILRKDILTFNAAAPEDIPELKVGDTNGDGEVDLADAIMIMQALCNPNKYGVTGTDAKHITLEGWKRGDVDGDGLTVGDALSIQEFLLGKRKSLH